MSKIIRTYRFFFLVILFLLIEIHIEGKKIPFSHKDKMSSTENEVQKLKEIPDDSITDENWKLIFYMLQNEIMHQEALLSKYRLVLSLFLFIFTSFIIYYLIKSIRILKSRSFPHLRKKKFQFSSLLCLQMLSKHYGKKVSYKTIFNFSGLEKDENLNLSKFVEVVEKAGFKVLVVQVTLNELAQLEVMPVLLYFPKHMAILYKFSEEHLHLTDPYYGLIDLNPYFFATSWYSDSKIEKGIALIPLPSEGFKHSKKARVSSDSVLKMNAFAFDKRKWKDLVCEA